MNSSHELATARSRAGKSLRLFFRSDHGIDQIRWRPSLRESHTIAEMPRVAQYVRSTGFKEPWVEDFLRRPTSGLTKSIHCTGLQLFYEWYGNKPLRDLLLRDLVDYQNSLGHLAPTTARRILNSVRSLLTFGHQNGFLAFNVGRPLRLKRLSYAKNVQ
jgi:hypothetical protein